MSEKVLTIDSISQAHQLFGIDKPKHPLVTVVHPKDFRSVSALPEGVKIVTNFYQIMLKVDGCGNLTYGKNSYDYEEGTLIFTSPGQALAYEDQDEVGAVNADEWTLAFHPDLIRRSDLGKNIHQYSFFAYNANEALHLSDEERKNIETLLEKIVQEYSQKLDRHSQHLIVANIELLLDYCLRFYDRQFYTRTNLNNDVITKFERLLHEYYHSVLVEEFGIPTVQYCAKELNLSPNYLSDLLKKETGKTAQEHLHLYVIERAKSSLLNSSSSISEIGYALGFEYPQHFSNLFKSKTGLSPRAFRNSN